MHTIIAEQHGAPEQLSLNALPTPSPSHDEVFVKVKAAGVIPLNIQTRRGY